MKQVMHGVYNIVQVQVKRSKKLYTLLLISLNVIFQDINFPTFKLQTNNMW